MGAPALESIKQGIKEGNWTKVCAGYYALTGEQLCTPQGDGGGSWQELVLRVHAILQPAVEACKPKSPEADCEYCCECGADYPHADLEAGHVTCSQCRKKEVERQQKGVAAPKPPIKKKAPAKGRSKKTAVIETPTSTDASATPTEPEDPLARYRIKHRQPAQDTREDGKKEARKLPFDKTQVRNEYVDAGDHLDAVDFDKKVHKSAPVPRRPAMKMVEVECSRCHRKEEVHPAAAPRRVAKDDDKNTYLCNSCIAGAVPRG